MNTAFVQTPIGPIQLTGDDSALYEATFLDAMPHPVSEFPSPTGMLKDAADQLNAYFEGTCTEFNLNLLPKGTDFQQKVWAELYKIPYGHTISYLELALRLGDEKCIRAAASANGKNPIGLIIPCHRVIGANGKLVGYAGGLWRKKHLLQHEMQYFKRNDLLF